MGLLWVATEPGRLVDGKGDVGPCVGGQVQQHSNCRRVGPFFVKVFAVFVRAEGISSRWSELGGGIFHAQVLDDLLGETSLSELDVSSLSLEVDAKETKDVSLPFDNTSGS